MTRKTEIKITVERHENGMMDVDIHCSGGAGDVIRGLAAALNHYCDELEMSLPVFMAACQIAKSNQVSKSGFSTMVPIQKGGTGK